MGTPFHSVSLSFEMYGFFFIPSRIPINVIVKNVLERFFFGCHSKNIDYRQISQTHKYSSRSRSNDRKELKVFKKKKKGPIFFRNILNNSCNDVNYNKFHCIMHIDHTVWHRRQPLNLQIYIFFTYRQFSI